jgi:hypothetical protein
MWQFRIVEGVICACIAALVAVAPGSPAQAVCLAPQQQLPAAEVEQFLSDPGAVLEDPAYKLGGAKLISRIRVLAASNPAALRVLIDLIAKGNPDQQTALGTGLAQAVCVKTDQPYATQIQQTMAAYPDKDNRAVFAFRAVLADSPIGALGGGEGVSGGAGEAGTLPLLSTLFASSAYVPWGPYGRRTVGFAGSFGRVPIATSLTGPPPPNQVTRSVSPH